MLKKFQVISKRFNKQCDVECCTPQEAQQMAADYDEAFVLSYNNPLTVRVVKLENVLGIRAMGYELDVLPVKRKRKS